MTEHEALIQRMFEATLSCCGDLGELEACTRCTLMARASKAIAALQSAIATARGEALEEAAAECARLAQRIGPHYGGQIAEQCASRIRALGGKESK